MNGVELFCILGESDMKSSYCITYIKVTIIYTYKI